MVEQLGKLFALPAGHTPDVPALPCPSTGQGIDGIIPGSERFAGEDQLLEEKPINNNPLALSAGIQLHGGELVILHEATLPPESMARVMIRSSISSPAIELVDPKIFIHTPTTSFDKTFRAQQRIINPNLKSNNN